MRRPWKGKKQSRFDLPAQSRPWFAVFPMSPVGCRRSSTPRSPYLVHLCCPIEFSFWRRTLQHHCVPPECSVFGRLLLRRRKRWSSLAIQRLTPRAFKCKCCRTCHSRRLHQKQYYRQLKQSLHCQPCSTRYFRVRHFGRGVPCSRPPGASGSERQRRSLYLAAVCKDTFDFTAEQALMLQS